MIVHPTYNNIRQLPLFNYFELVDTGELRYLLILDNYIDLPILQDEETESLKEIFDTIKAEIIDYTGVSDNYLTALRMQKDIALNKAELVLTGDVDLVNQIQLQISEFEEFKKENTTTTQTIYKQCAVIEKHFGFQFDLFKTTVYRWLTYNDIFTEQLKTKSNG